MQIHSHVLKDAIEWIERAAQAIRQAALGNPLPQEEALALAQELTSFADFLLDLEMRAYGQKGGQDTI